MASLAEFEAETVQGINYYSSRLSATHQIRTQVWQCVMNMQSKGRSDRFIVGTLHGELKVVNGIQGKAPDESVRLNVATVFHYQWRSYLELRLIIRWLDEQMVKKDSRMLLRFGATETSSPIEHHTWKTLTPEAQADYVKHFDLKGEALELVKTEKIYFVQFQHGNNVQATNVYNDHTYGSQQYTVDQVRRIFANSGSVRLMVRGEEGKHFIETLNEHIVDQRQTDRTAGFYLSKKANNLVEIGAIPEKEYRPVVYLPRQITYPDKRNYITAQAYAVIHEMEMLESVDP